MKAVNAFLRRAASAFFARRLRRLGVVVGARLDTRHMPIVQRCPGSRIELGDDCVLVHTTRQNIAGILHPTTLGTTTPEATLVIGRNVGLSGAIIVAARAIRIEDDVMIGANAKIYDNDFHPLDFPARLRNDQAATAAAPVVVRRGAWIGADAVLLKGVEVGEFAVVGARAVVTRSVPRCGVVAGNPARLVKTLPDPSAPA